MLICAKCHRSNAPWAKLCNACKESLTDSSPDTWMAPTSQTPDPSPAPLEPNTVIGVENLNPDTEWHGANDIDTTKILDARSNEPPTLSRFDSQPIPVKSRNRLEEEHFEFEHPSRSNHRRLLGLISGLICIGVFGAWGISYLHSTTQTAALRQTNTSASKPNAAEAARGSTKNAANTPNSTGTIEQVVPNSQLKPLTQVPVPVSTAPRSGSEPSQANTPQTSPAQAQKQGAPVFVMSASEAIATKPVNTVAISVPRTQVHTQSTARKAEPKLVEQRPENRPIARVKPRSETKIDAGNEAGAVAAISMAKTDTRSPRYQVLVPVTANGVGGNNVKGNGVEPKTELGNQGAGAGYASDINSTLSSSPESALAARLHVQQRNDCSNAAFLSKGICEERTRLSFCKNRGSDHPDCRPNSHRLDP
jgi:hypothetical protein